MILTPRSAERAVSLVPFRDLADQLGGTAAGAVVQVGGNLLVLAAAASMVVEVLQYALDLGRVSSADDVLVNTAGAVLAAMCSRRWWAGRYREGSPAPTVGR